MRTRIILAFVLMLGCTWLQSAEPQQPNEKNADQELKKLDADLSQAAVKVDLDFIEKHLGHEFALIDPAGVVSERKKVIKNLKDGTLKFDSFKDSDVKVQVLHSKAAVLSGRTEIKGKENGLDISGAYRFIRVYTWRDDTWKMVADQLTAIAKP